MKKLTPCLIFLGLLGMAFFPAISKGQEEKLYQRDWYCCHCKKHFLTEYLPGTRRQDMGRREDILCPDCIKMLDGLQKGLDSLLNLNRSLYGLYRAYQQQYADALAKLNAAMERFWGKEAEGQPNLWDYYTGLLPDPTFNRRGLSGLQGSFGGFANAVLSLSSNYKSSLQDISTHISNGISIYQSGASVSPDGGMTWGGVYFDYILGSPLINSIWYHRGMKSALDVFKTSVGDGASLSGAVTQYNMETSVAYEAYMKNIQSAEKAGKALDVIGFILSSRNLLTDLLEIGENNRRIRSYKNKMDSLSNEIWKNESLINCIRQTMDYKSGKTGFKKQLRPLFNYAMLSPAYLQVNKITIPPGVYIPVNTFDTTWSLDESRLNSALNKLAQLDNSVNSMSDIVKKLIPLMLPWAIKDWQGLKPAILLDMLKKTRASLPGLLAQLNKAMPLAQSILDDLVYIITGYEIEYNLNTNNTEFHITSASNPRDTTTWTMIDNTKIKPGMGRVSMSLPSNAEWSLDIYTNEDKFFTNRSSYSKHQSFYDIDPGNYIFHLNSVPIKNVPIEKGKEAKLRVGFLNIITTESWYLSDESKEKYYTSNNRPIIIALPVGSYTLHFEGKDYKVVIKNKSMVKFKRQLQFLGQ